MSLFDKVDINDFSSVEIEIYKYVVNNIDKVVFMRVRDIALNANVSSTSVFRFIKKVGFASFPEFKMYLKSNLESANLSDENKVLNLNQRIDDLSTKIFHPDVEYQIKQMAKRIFEADSLVFLGMGSSGAIAEYISRKFANLDYFSLSINELTYPINSILKKTSKNVVITLSVSGETKEVIEAVAGIEHKESVFTYCITAGKNSTLSRVCDYSTEYFIEAKREKIFYDFSSQIPAVLILETIFGYVYQYKLDQIKETLN